MIDSGSQGQLCVVASRGPGEYSQPDLRPVLFVMNQKQRTAAMVEVGQLYPAKRRRNLKTYCPGKFGEAKIFAPTAKSEFHILTMIKIAIILRV